MTIREDDSIEVNLIGAVDGLFNREEIRSFILCKWIEEEAQMKYRYFVETLENNGRIYLERPGRLNKGCDFVIYVENKIVWKNGNDRPPDHNFILGDLRQKKHDLPYDSWRILLAAIEKIYNCSSYEDSVAELGEIDFGTGHSVELIIKTLKWLFIEQDITYWSGEGRGMLFAEIMNIGH